MARELIMAGRPAGIDGRMPQRQSPAGRGAVEPAYRHLAPAMLALPLVLLLGFWVPYFSLIPRFPADITVAVHAHALAQFAWVSLLVLQPAAAANGWFRLHRALGRASYGLIALIVMLGAAMVAKEYGEAVDAGRSIGQAARGEYLSAVGLALLAGLYVFAIRAIRAHDVGAHLRYMVCTAIALAPAGIGRALGYGLGVRLVSSNTISLAFVDASLLALIAFDHRRGLRCRPYVVALAAYAAMELGWIVLGRPT